LQRNPVGPYYINIGDGGNLEGLHANWYSPQPDFSAFRQATYGHGELQVFNATHAFWSWHQNPDLEPTIADHLWIVKGRSAEIDAMRSHGIRHGHAYGVTKIPKFRRR
jgi:hypothetical protein